MGIEAACIDVTGSSRSMDIAYVENNVLKLTIVSGRDAFFDWVEQYRPQCLAIDAPSKHNTGQVENYRKRFSIPDGKYGNFRVAEVLLKMKGVGLYNTPMEDADDWMVRGWEIYDKLRGKGFKLVDQPGTIQAEDEPTMLEVHPHACFVVGLGWIPQTKSGLAGQIERVAYLRQECLTHGLDVSETFLAEDQLEPLKSADVTWESIVNNGIRLPVVSHDQLDATAGLLTAIRAKEGKAFGVGVNEDGIIVVPNELSDVPYIWKHK